MKNKTNKANNGNKRYNLLIDTIERYENFQYVDRALSISWCCSSIEWLWKWRKITEEEMESLCDRMIAIMECQRSLRLY